MSFIRELAYGVLAVDPATDREAVFQKIDKADVVSFDVFDTLVKRNVERPEDVFELVELAAVRSGIILDCDFRSLRVAAEKRTRESSEYEVNLDEIYSMMDLDEGLATRLKALEIEAEQLVCVRNESVAPYYEYARSLGKQIVFVSDMYLSKNMICDILQKCKYDVGELFVSSEYRCSKAEGGLFDLVLEKLHCNSSSMFHMGDSITGDFLSARRRGIGAILIPRYAKSRFCWKDMQSFNVGERCMVAVGRNLNSREEDVFYRFGAEVFGPLLFGFAKWVHEVAIKEEAERIFFLARDGYIVKQAYDCLFGNESKTEYMYASRRALKLPSCLNEKDLISCLPRRKNITLDDIFDSLGVDVSCFGGPLEVPSETHLRDYTEFLDSPDYASCRDALFRQALGAAKKERAAAFAYFDEIGIESGDVIVDIGWHGSMQSCLERILSLRGQRCELVGCYVGMEIKEKSLDMDARGYLGEFFPASYIGLVETCFLANEGSTKRYTVKNGVATPELYPYEYDLTDESRYMASCVAAIQKGALDYVANIAGLETRYGFAIAPERSYEGFSGVGTNPSRSDLETLGSLFFFDEGEVSRLAVPRTLRHYVRDFRGLKVDFSSSRWKVGFMKKLFRLPLPYQKIYEYAAKKWK